MLITKFSLILALFSQLTIEGSKEVEEHRLVVLTLKGIKSDGTIWETLYVPNIAYLVSQEYDNDKLIFTGKPGNYRVSAYVSSNNKIYQAVTIVTIGKSTEPKPPEPEPKPPEPEPPKPKPTPLIDPSPIPDPGLRVLIVYESQDVAKYPYDQVVAMNSQKLRNHMTSVCVKDNQHSAWRIYDQDTNIANDTQQFQKMMALPRQNLPWIIISNGTTGYQGPLPPTTDEIIKLINKYEIPPKARIGPEPQRRSPIRRVQTERTLEKH
jgi:hypothetical protein